MSDINQLENEKKSLKELETKLKTCIVSSEETKAALINTESILKQHFEAAKKTYNQMKKANQLIHNAAVSSAERSSEEAKLTIVRMHHGYNSYRLTHACLRNVKYLSSVSEQKYLAKKELKIVKHEIVEWENCYNQQKDGLKKVQAEILKVENREIKVLQSKLDKLGGAKPLTKHDCVVCWERPREIVFQCGHQCCSTCAQSVSRCPYCRKRIVQRIKLYG